MHRVYHLDDPIVSRYWRWLTGVVRHGFGNTASTDIGGSPMQVLTPGVPITPIVLRRARGHLADGRILARLRLDRQCADRLGRRAAAAARAAICGRAGSRIWAPPPRPSSSRTSCGRSSFRTSITCSATASTGQQSTSTWLQVGPPSTGLQSWTQHLILPTFALALGLVGIYARYIRSAMVVQFGQPYVTVARAKGLPRIERRRAPRAGETRSCRSRRCSRSRWAASSARHSPPTGCSARAALRRHSCRQSAQRRSVPADGDLHDDGDDRLRFAFIGDFVVGLLDPRMRRD